MKSVLKFFFFLFFQCNFLNAQINVWTWMAGSNTVNASGNFGTQGVAAATNTPPNLYEACEWTDLQGNLWLYGGQDFTTSGYYSDLWKYDVTTNMWTWVKGNGSASGAAAVYGTQGVAAAANSPGGRGNCCMTWVDPVSGDLYLFGGDAYTVGGTGQFSDMWKYNIASNQWTWLKGPMGVNVPGVYGTLGVSAPANNPPSRSESSVTWVDNNGKFWMFGGTYSFFSGTPQSGCYNDMWMYDPVTNNWTWMSGSNLTNQPGVYGTLGVQNAANIPGGRMAGARWKDNAGNLWLFGGYGNCGGVPGSHNDLWKCDISGATPIWTWMGGSNTTNAPGVYGTQCVPSTSNIPPAAYENRGCWKDGCGNFWLLGNRNFSTASWYNTLWKYNPSTGEWTWTSGNSTANGTGNYGTVNVPLPTNLPPARSGNNGWTDNTGNMWIFGGINSSYNYFNDLWRYSPDTVSSSFTAMPDSGCAALNVNFTSTSNANCGSIKSYYWNFDDPSSGSNDSSLLMNPSHLFINPGNYNVKLIVQDCIGRKDTSTRLIVVTPAAAPITVSSSTVICTGSNVTLTASGASSYYWSPSAGLSSTTGSSITASPLVPTTYTVIGGTGACADVKTIFINVNSLPVLSVSGVTDLCTGDSSTLTANGAANYIWSPGSGLSSTTGSTITFNGSSPGTYTIIGTDANGCSNASQFSININSIPVVNAGPDDSICAGQSTTLSASGGSGFLWSTNASTNSIVVNPPLTGIYSVTVSNGSCVDVDSVKITVFTNPVADAGNGVMLVYGTTATLSGSGGGNYFWQPSAGLSCVTCSHPTITTQTTTMYYLIVTDNNGCTSMDSVLVEVDLSCGEIFVPNAFSPNEDGQNDVLVIKANCIMSITFAIYDRWGEKVFEARDIQTGWDGKYKEKLLNTGVFAYTLQAQLIDRSEIVRKGNISLIR